MSPDWDGSTAVVHLSPSGRIDRATFTHRSHDHPDAWMCLEYQITEAAAPGEIELPKPEATISLEHCTVEQMNVN